MEPLWKVVMVTGEEGPCEDCGREAGPDAHAYFAYTVGLHEYFGRPEVHCAGLSDDEEPLPLGYDTVGKVLNAIAARIVGRQLGPGSDFDVMLSDGHAQLLLRFTLGLPTRPLAVTALMANPDATVIPVRWTVVESDCPCTRRAS